MNLPAPDPAIPDIIHILGIDLPTRIGVPDEERAALQNLVADLELHLVGRVEDFADDIAATVDYDSVARQTRAVAMERPRCLIESLAAEVARELLKREALWAVKVTIKKRVLPGTDHVAVSIYRSR